MTTVSRYIVAAAATLCVAGVDAQTKLPALDANVEITYSLPNGQQFSRQGHIYRSESGKVRQDLGRGSMITDLSNGTVTLLMAEKKEARVLSIPTEQRSAKKKELPAAERFEEATIDGHRVVKARTKGPKGEVQEFWTATDLGIVTFSRVTSGGITTTLALHKISVRKPDSSVFQVPSDYKVVHQTVREDVFSRPADPAAGHPLERVTMVPAPSAPAPKVRR